MTDETIGNVPILILGNKIDRPEAISEERLREIFGLYGQTTGKVRSRLFPSVLASNYKNLSEICHLEIHFLSLN